MSSSFSQAQLWAAQRRAAIAKADAIRLERQRDRHSSETAELPFDPSDRHLPNCKCQFCASEKIARPTISVEASHAHSGGWNNEFTEGCKDGFDALLRERKKQQRRASSKKKEQLASFIGGDSEHTGMKSSRSAPGLRALVAPSSKASEGPSTRINFDKRTSRHMHAMSFSTAISKFRAESQFIPGVCFDKIRFFVRKRPLFEQERARGEYDVVTCSRFWTVVHVCGMAPDLQRMHIIHHQFPCAEAFNETATNDEVQLAAMAPLVTHSLNGGMSTCLMYGATGSGKTFTMSAMQERAADALCAAGVVTLSMLELAGKDVRDLLAPGGAQVVTLRENGEGRLDLGGTSLCKCADSGHLIASLTSGQERRKTCTTLANATSSRSHLVCLLALSNGGSLVLVDCAGSERREDSSRHTTDRQREGAEINSSLLALKECIRALVSGAHHVPYRMNTLTRLLRESFTRPGAKFHVVATVAPGCSDAEHSVGTLRTACCLCECSDQVQERKENVHPVAKSGGRDQDGDAMREGLSNRASMVSHLWTEDSTSHVAFAKQMQSPSEEFDALPQTYADHNNISKIRRNKISSSRRGGSLGPIATGVKPPPPEKISNQKRNRPSGEVNQKTSDSPAVTIPHPSKWTVQELERWLRQQKIAAALPLSTDGRVVVRWNLKRWIEACGGDERVGLRAFNGLRLEMDRLADEEKRRRKQLMSGR